MIYAAFTLWLFLILFAGMGVYRLGGRIVTPNWLNWALLPGTVVSEMAYIFGCLITGGEIRRARLMPDAGGGGKGGGGQPATEASGGLKVLGPILASLLAIVACAGAILALNSLLGQQIVGEEFGRMSRDAQLAKTLPQSADAFWAQLEGQVRLLRRTWETWCALPWLNWRVPLFVYLAACLAVRIAPVSRPVRPTLAAAVVIALLIGGVGLASKSFANLMSDVWPLVTYIWASLLFMLVVTLLIAAGVQLVGVLGGKGPKAKGK